MSLVELPQLNYYSCILFRVIVITSNPILQLGVFHLMCVFGTLFYLLHCFQFLFNCFILCFIHCFYLFVHRCISFVFHELSSCTPDVIMKIVKQAEIESEYDFVKELGSGSFGQVWLAINKHSKLKCAAKVIDKPRFMGLGCR